MSKTAYDVGKVVIVSWPYTMGILTVAMYLHVSTATSDCMLL